jgi:hypothetical protein
MEKMGISSNNQMLFKSFGCFNCHFELPDPEAANNLPIRDLLCYQVGLSGQPGALFGFNNPKFYFWNLLFFYKGLIIY